MNLWTVPLGAMPTYEAWPPSATSVAYTLEGVSAPAWSNPPVLDAHAHGIAGDGMSDDSKPLARFLEDALASPGSWIRIRRGIYRVDEDVDVWVPGAVAVPAQEIEKSTEPAATCATDLHHPSDATPSAGAT